MYHTGMVLDWLALSTQFPWVGRIKAEVRLPLDQRISSAEEGLWVYVCGRGPGSECVKIYESRPQIQGTEDAS